MSTITTEEPRWPELHKARRAIVVVDVVESVRLMQQHEDDVIDRWRRFVHEVRTEVLPPHGGRLVKSLGDGMLLEFGSSLAAVSATFDLADRSVAFGERAVPVRLRQGVHVADVVVDALDVFGAGVNLAARLASLAGPGEIVVSAEVRDQLIPQMDANVVDLGECYLKHIDRPVRCFRVARAGRVSVTATQSAAAEALVPVVAVLPFAELSPASRPVAQVLADELIAVLSSGESLRIVSRLSSTRLAGRKLPSTDAARLLNARYVVSGSVGADARRVVVRLEVADAASGTVVWSGKLRGSSSDLFEVDDELVGEMSSAIVHAVGRSELRRLESQPLPTLESHTLMMGGVTLMHRTAAHDFERAREVLEYLADRCGRHPLPRAWLAKWHVLRVQQGWSTNATADASTAIALAKSALDAQPTCGLALTIEGFARANLLREFDAAEACYDAALALNGSDSLAWLLKGMVRAFRDDGAAALEACERGRALSPLDPMKYFYDALTASAALTAGDYQRAIALSRTSLSLNAAHLSTYRALTAALVLDGQVEEAREVAAQLLRLDPGFTVTSFLERTPGRAFRTSRRIAAALREAGVPV